jgi:transcriptional regulator with XRE-family HTH domain
MARRIEPAEARRIGLRIRSAREAIGWTLIEVGARCEIHHSQASRIERGQFRTLNSNVQLLCKFAQVDPNDAGDPTTIELHARLDTLIQIKPQVAGALRALFDAFERMSR